MEDIYPGLQKTFLKLKQSKRLENDDITPLLKFGRDTITCSTDPKVLMSQFGINMERAEKIVNMVKEVNTHHHTKTCRKYKTDCRFKFPRYPSLFYIIAQELPPSENKHELLSRIYFVLDNVQRVIKSYANEDSGKTQSIATMLKDALPNIKFDKNNQTFVIYHGDEMYDFDVTTVIQTYNFLSGNHASPEKMSDTDLRSALYHYCLSISDYGTKLILKREVV